MDVAPGVVTAPLAKMPMRLLCHGQVNSVVAGWQGRGTPRGKLMMPHFRNGFWPYASKGIGPPRFRDAGCPLVFLSDNWFQ